MSSTTILVADDDRAIRTVLTQALARLGHDVRATGNTATLWRWIEDGDGDLVITDVLMPDGNGLDLLPRIRKQRPELRVVVMSAQNTLLTAVKATERGAFEYLPKPFDLNELVPKLILVAFFLLVGFPVHEFAHAFVAYRLGDGTAKLFGRLTLDPRAHFDPIGGMMVALTALLPGGLILGWAKPTPVNPANLRDRRNGEVWVSLAGPLSNLLMAAVGALVTL